MTALTIDPVSIALLGWLVWDNHVMHKEIAESKRRLRKVELQMERWEHA